MVPPPVLVPPSFHIGRPLQARGTGVAGRCPYALLPLSAQDERGRMRVKGKCREDHVSYRTILFETVEPMIAQIAINRPDRMNAYTNPMCDEIGEALRHYMEDDAL